MIYFSQLTSTRNQIPIGECLAWDQTLIFINIVSYSLAAVACLAISLSPIYLSKRHKILPITLMRCFAITALCSFFIYASEIVSMWYPESFLYGALRILVSITMLTTAGFLVRTLTRASDAPNEADLHSVNVRLEREILDKGQIEEEMRRLNSELESRVRSRTVELETTNAALMREVISRRVAEEGQARLTDIIHSSNDAIISTSLDEIITTWNPSAQRILGYAAEEAIGQPISMLLPTDRVAERAQSFKHVIEGRVVEPFETVRVSKEGKLVSISASLSPIRDRSGTIVGASTICRDITERERSAEIMLRSEERLTAVIANLEEGILVAPDDGGHLSWNSAALKMHGLSGVEEACTNLGKFSQTFELLTLDGVLIPVEEWPLSRVVAGQDVHGVEVRIRRRDIVWERIVRCNGAAVHYSDDQILAFISITDITEQKLTEQMRSAVVGAEIGTWHWNLMSRLIRCSDKCKDILGISRLAELSDNEFLDALHPQDREAFQDIISSALKTRSPVEIEVRCGISESRMNWVLFKGVASYDERGVAQSLEGIAFDVTVRKKSEFEIRELNSNLELKAAELEEAHRELESFSYSVSHDLRAPLRHIEGYTELIVKHASSVLDERSSRYLNIVVDTAGEMSTLIDNLLQFSKLGRAEMQVKPLELSSLVDSVIGGLEQDIAGRTLEWERAPLPTVQGDPLLIKQVYVNLLSNAIKYTRKADTARVEIGCLNNLQDEIVLYVRDNGAGFDMQYADKLFGVFQRLHHADEFEGTGIGLANVRMIVKRHHGRVWAESEVGVGSTFFFTLPLTPPVENGHGKQ